MPPEEYDKAIASVVNYLTERGFTVNLKSNSYGYYPDDALITCPSIAAGTYNMLCGLLHEAGHTVQTPSTFTTLRKSKKRDQAIIAEQEYKAWIEGWTIASTIYIATPEFHQHYQQSFLQHWTAYIRTIYITATQDDIRALVDSYEPRENI